MKKTVVIIMIFLVILNLFGCTNSSDKNPNSSLDDYIIELQNQNIVLQRENEDLQNNVNKLAQLTEENLELKNQLKNILAQIEFTMQYRETDYVQYFIPELASMSCIPLPGANVSNELQKGAIVDALATVFVSGDTWILVRKETYDSPSNDIGWLLLDSTVPFSNELSKQATDHIMIAKDCIDLNKNKSMSEYFDDYNERHYGISHYDGESVWIYAEGGQTFLVGQEVIIYPTVSK